MLAQKFEFQRYVIVVHEIKTCILLISVNVCVCDMQNLSNGSMQLLQTQYIYALWRNAKCTFTEFWLTSSFEFYRYLNVPFFISYYRSLINTKEHILVINYFKVEWKIIKVKSRRSKAIKCLLKLVGQTFYCSREGHTDINHVHVCFFGLIRLFLLFLLLLLILLLFLLILFLLLLLYYEENIQKCLFFYLLYITILFVLFLFLL